MQNRFGLKDFVMLVLLLLVLASIWLAMVQRNRTEVVLREVFDHSRKLETQLAQVQEGQRKTQDAVDAVSERIEKGVQVTGARTEGAPAAPPAASWERPGVPVERFPVPTYTNDPTKMPGYSVGGTFTELWEAAPAKVVPYLSTDVYGSRVIDRVAESLGVVEPRTLQIVGLLAEAWQVDPDGFWVRVRVHQRARFSDGSPVLADDVIYTFKDYVLNPEIDAQRARSIIDNLKDVVKVDERTVEFQFVTGLFTNAMNALLNPILPKAYYTQFVASQVNTSTGLLMGSGPFQMATLPTGPQDLLNQWTPGRDVVLKRNEQYWAGKAPLESLRFRTVNDELPRFVSYTNGEGDMMRPTSVQYRKVLREQPNFVESNYALNWVNMRSLNAFVAWQCGPRAGKKLTPFADVRVRRAMTMLLDREKFIRDVYDGVGIVSKGPMNPESPASDPALKPMPYDPEAAKKLLAEAGWIDRDGDGVLENEKRERFEFELTRATGGATAERVSNFLLNAYKEAGILMRDNAVEWASMVEIQRQRDFDAITLGWSSTQPESDPRQQFHSDSIKNQGDNMGQWSNATADELIQQGRMQMNPATRQLIWRQLEAVIAEEQPYTWLQVAPWLRFVKRGFGNVIEYKSGLSPQEFFKIAPGAMPVPNN